MVARRRKKQWAIIFEYRTNCSCNMSCLNVSLWCNWFGFFCILPYQDAKISSHFHFLASALKKWMNEWMNASCYARIWKFQGRGRSNFFFFFQLRGHTHLIMLFNDARPKIKTAILPFGKWPALFFLHNYFPVGLCHARSLSAAGLSYPNYTLLLPLLFSTSCGT